MTLDGNSFRTEPSACIIFDKKYHQKWKPENGGIVHDWIHISGDLPALLSKLGIEFNKVYYPSSPNFITKLCEELEVEFFAKKQYGEELCCIGIEKLFYLMARSTEENDALSVKIDTESEKKLRELRSELLGNLERPMSADEMARRLSVSQSKFYVMYKTMFGISPQKDIINARLEKAKVYLASGQYSVAETAFLLGYTNPFHFIRQFKQMEGVTPGEYSKTGKGER